MADILDLVIGNEIAIEIYQMAGGIEPQAVIDDPIAQRRINKEFDIPAKEGGKRLQDTPGQILIVFLGENIFEIGIAKNDAHLQPGDPR